MVRQGPHATGVTEADDAVAATPVAEKDPGRAGWLFGAVTVIPALLAVAWLLPAFPLLLGGRLAARPMVIRRSGKRASDLALKAFSTQFISIGG